MISVFTGPLVNETWMQRAECARVDANGNQIHDPEIFFAKDSSEFDRDSPANREARSVCSSCPVIADCFQWATENHEEYGMWAMETGKERRKRLKNRGDGNAL